jgi:hypothetical protein
MTRGVNGPSLRKYNLSPADYDRLFDSQNGVCALCFRDIVLVIDHDHDCCPPGGPLTQTCGTCVRGLLCYRCNNLLGYIQGTPIDVLVRALRYLDGHNPRKVDPRMRDAVVPAIADLLRYSEEAA